VPWHKNGTSTGWNGVSNQACNSFLYEMRFSCRHGRCVHYGVLPHDEAERLHSIVTERKRAMRLGGGVISSPSPAAKKKKKKPKLLQDEAHDDPDVVVSFRGDGIGEAAL
jgi:hypothetical protein